MTSDDSHSGHASKLRQRAEEIARRKTQKPSLPLANLSPDDAQLMLHELQIHQIELEMQNEELRRTQGRLEVARALYFDLFDLAPVGYLTIDKNGLILETNLAAAKLLGVPRDTLTRQLLTNFILPEDQDVFYLYKRQLSDQSKPQSCELRIMRKDASPIYVRMELDTTIDLNGATVSRAVIIDISVKKKQADDAMALSEARYASIVENQTELVCRHFPDGRLSFVNNAYVKFHGKTREDILNVKSMPGIPEPDTSIVFREISAITSDSKTVEFEHQVPMPDGTVKWLHWIYQGIFSGENEIIEYQGAGRDITMRKQAEDAALHAKEEADAANQAKSQFLANMSHELRTPLNPIIGFTDILAEAPNLTDEQRLWTNIMRRRSYDLLALIGNILDFCKIEVEKIVLEPKPASLRHMMDDMVSATMPLTAKKGLKLKSHVAETLPDSISIDGLRLRQIILNLLNNAIKFTDAGQVELRVESTTPDRLTRPLEAGETPLLFSVRDTGIGIVKEKQSIIFDAFQQADNSHATIYGGAGLGLAIAWNLTKLMGGKMWVESEPGQGSTFFFTISATNLDPQLDASTQIATTDAASHGKTLKILVVDDDEPCRMIQELFLRLRYGDNIKSAKNGGEALAILEAETFDLILMDGRMPDMDGVTATKIIRSNEAQTGKHTPIIAVTAHAMTDNHDDFLAAGMDAFLTKPIHKAVLYNTIDKVLQSLANPN